MPVHRGLVLKLVAPTWQARAEAAEREMTAVKQRAWALMEEKDAQLLAAKVCFCTCKAADRHSWGAAAVVGIM